MKKSIMYLVTAGLLGSAVSMTSVASQAAVGPAYQQGTYGYVCTHSRYGKLSMRTGASTRYRVKLYIPNGSDVRILSSVNARDGFTWFKVRYGKYVGWVRSDYVCG